MSRLLLLRHAKSSWADPGQDDLDRPLSSRGRRDAANMAKAIAAGGDLPDRILCSPARRTRETLAALLPYLSDDTRIVTVPELYEPASGDYRAVIAERGGKAATLMVIGHNPAIQATAVFLIGGGDSPSLEAVASKFPTGALVAIDFAAADWAALSPQSGSIRALVKPRDLDPEAAED